MTNTAKPTPGPWHVVRIPGHNGIGELKIYSSDMGLPVATAKSCWSRRKEDANLIAEAGTVFHETNLTPRQLVERVGELEELVKDLLPYAKAAVPFPVAVGEPTVFERAEATLAKHGEGV